MSTPCLAPCRLCAASPDGMCEAKRRHYADDDRFWQELFADRDNQRPPPPPPEDYQFTHARPYVGSVLRDDPAADWS